MARNVFNNPEKAGFPTDQFEQDGTLKIEPPGPTEPQKLPDHSAVAAWWEMRRKGKPTGWVQFSGMNVWFENGVERFVTVADEQEREWNVKTDKIEGIPLAAELCIGKESHHLRPTGNGWTATKLTREPCGGPVLETRQFLRNTKGRTQILTYEVAWKPDAKTGALRPDVFRLINPNALKS